MVNLPEKLRHSLRIKWYIYKNKVVSLQETHLKCRHSEEAVYISNKPNQESTLRSGCGYWWTVCEVREEDTGWLESSGNQSNDVRRVLFTSSQLSVATTTNTLSHYGLKVSSWVCTFTKNTSTHSTYSAVDYSRWDDDLRRAAAALFIVVCEDSSLMGRH